MELNQKQSVKADLPDFPLDKYGFPDPGLILRYFRERMRYTDPRDGKVKSWTQMDLAKRLGVSEVTVRLMETQNKGLDSIERRRVLADLLMIPPALLGLTPLINLVETLDASQEKGGNKETVKLYQDAFHVYSEMYIAGMTENVTPVLETWISRIQNSLAHTLTSQRTALMETLWNFHALIARIYCDNMAWLQSFSHLDAALKFATELNSSDLQAASLYRSSAVHFVQRNYALAKVDLDGALIYAKKADLHIRGTILVDAGLAYALTATDYASVLYSQQLLDQAEKYAGNWVDNGVMNFGSGKYLLRKARTLIALERPGKALEYLDEAEKELNPNQKLKLAFINIARAESFMKLKRPEFDRTLILLINAFEASKAIKSEFNIGHVQSLYNDLVKSSYGTSPEVADLGLELKEWHRIK